MHTSNLQLKSVFSHSYHPIPVVLSKGEGVYLWDVEGKKYFDFLSAYSSVSQGTSKEFLPPLGHSHPRIKKALIEQAEKLTLCSRAFYNDQLGPFAKKLRILLGYESMLPMNTGAEGVETAFKLARKWGYLKKGIAEGEAIILAAEGNFHGRTMAAVTMSTDPTSYEQYGPLLSRAGAVCPVTGKILRYGVIEDLKAALEAHGGQVAGFLVEPIQGEAG